MVENTCGLSDKTKEKLYNKDQCKTEKLVCLNSLLLNHNNLAHPLLEINKAIKFITLLFLVSSCSKNNDNQTQRTENYTF